MGQAALIPPTCLIHEHTLLCLLLRRTGPVAGCLQACVLCSMSTPSKGPLSCRAPPLSFTMLLRRQRPERASRIVRNTACRTPAGLLLASQLWVNTGALRAKGRFLKSAASVGTDTANLNSPASVTTR